MCPLISVVVPVYKTEKYLRDCAESILSQTFTDFELILVDDGSHDKAGELCDELAKQNTRIRVFHKENGGVTSARRLGVEQALGEWICFVDSDDLLTKNALEELFSTAEKFGDEVDLVEGNHTKFRENPEAGAQEFFDEFRVKQDIIASGLEYARGIVNVGPQPPIFSDGPWAKIIRRNLFEKTNALDLPKWIFNREDTLMDLLLATKIRTAVRVPKLVYKYRSTESSASSCEANRSVINSLSYTLSLFEILKSSYVGLDEDWQRVARLFALFATPLRNMIRRCNFSVLKDPACKEILAIQREESPDLPTKLFLARYSFPWKFVSNSIFKIIFTVVRETCRPFEQLKRRTH